MVSNVPLVKHLFEWLQLNKKGVHLLVIAAMQYYIY